MSANDKSKVDVREKKLMVEMESHQFNSADPVSILDLLQTFKRACNNLEIHEGSTIFFFAHLMHGSAKQDLLHPIEGDSDDEDLDDDQTGGALRS